MKCDFCANSSLPEEIMFMDINTASYIATELIKFGPKMRIVFAMRGEPTLNDAIHSITSIFRTVLPESQITLITNGSRCTLEFAVEWLNSGGNILAIDCYGKSFETFKYRFQGKSGFVFVDKYDSNIWCYRGSRLRELVLIPDIVVSGEKSREFENQADWIPKEAYDKYNIKKPGLQPLVKKCVNPFRELVIQYDGSVPLCCKDWTGQRILFKEDYYENWFLNEQLNQLRYKLLCKDRSEYPCSRCTSDGGYRIGLLPTAEEFKKENL
jgi:hypothetical protein